MGQEAILMKFSKLILVLMVLALAGCVGGSIQPQPKVTSDPVTCDITGRVDWDEIFGPDITVYVETMGTDPEFKANQWPPSYTGNVTVPAAGLYFIKAKLDGATITPSSYTRWFSGSTITGIDWEVTWDD
jgi:hypothetical protein